MPDSANAYNNMGNILKYQGKLEAAIEAYSKALDLKPDYAEAIENSLSLAVQLFPIIANYGYDFETNDRKVKSEVVLRPKYQVQQLIKTFLEADFSKAYSHNYNFKACDQKFFHILGLEDKNFFCYKYRNFIGKLLDADWDEEFDVKNRIYHLGESH